MRKTAGIFLLILMPLIGLSQGDCLGDAQVIDECGSSFSLNTGNMTACGSSCNDQGGPSCNGPDLDQSNWDGSYSSDCGTCGCGCDINGSTENNAFWQFVPQNSCDYTVSFEVTNCTDGIQYGIFEMANGLFTGTYAQDGGQNTGSFSESFSVTAGDTVVVGVDGFGGAECDVDISVSQSGCSDCVLPVEMLDLRADRDGTSCRLEWETASESRSSHYVVQRMCSSDWERVGRVEAAGNSVDRTEYSFEDACGTSECYYRLVQVDLDGRREEYGPVAVDELEGRKVKQRYDIYGNKVGPGHRGFVIVVYENGGREKKFKD